jgi:hypothetical protein
MPVRLWLDLSLAMMGGFRRRLMTSFALQG